MDLRCLCEFFFFQIACVAVEIPCNTEEMKDKCITLETSKTNDHTLIKAKVSLKKKTGSCQQKRK
jgi:hypothetical protein